MALYNTLTSLTGVGFYYGKSSRHATYNFSQDATFLYRNHPRLPFEYYININFNQVGTARDYISKYFNNTDLSQLMPLVKTIDMPSVKIETTPMNQYNRRRLSQTKINYDPVKMVFHDVADGKTLKLWDMYSRYYFGDGTETRMNDATPVAKSKPGFLETLVGNLTPQLDPNIANLPSNISSIFGGKKVEASTITHLGSKEDTLNIITDTLNNHQFGFNLDQVQEVRHLIQSIDIFQVHGGKFNQVRLVNPRFSSFTHDTLNYAATDRTLELSFSVEYEYAYYIIQNMDLTDTDKKKGGQNNNNSSVDQFKHGEFLELPALAFNAQLASSLESNNPLLESDNPLLRRIGKNVQSKVTTTTGAFLSTGVRKAGASVLTGLGTVSPKPYAARSTPPIVVKSFKPTASTDTTKSSYTDVNRSIGVKNG